MFKIFTLPENIDTKARNAFWATFVLLVVLVLFDVYATYNLITLRTVDRLQAALISYAMTVVVFIGIWASRRGNGSLAGWLLICGSLLSLFFSLFTRSDVGVLYAVVGFIVTTAIASLTLPNRQVWGAIVISIAAGAIYILMDSFLAKREAAVESVRYIYMIFTILIIGILLLVIRQAWPIIAKSLRLKITVWTGATAAVLSILLVSYAAITARQSAIKTAEKEALALASAQARLVRADAEIPLDTARALAQALTAAKDPDNTYRNLSRSQVNSILRQVLIENPNFLGTYTLWEPDAFDGQDSFYRGAKAHDLTGRFIPYWIRSDDGSIYVTALEQYETPGIGDWYRLPRQTKKEIVIAPLIYPINGVDTVMASFVVPILYRDKFYGVAGIDAPISYTQNLLDTTNLYNGKADVMLMNAKGTLIGVRNRPEMANHSASELFPDFANLQSKFKNGEDFISLSPDGQYLRVFAKVDLGRTGDHWVFGLIIPFSEITTPATRAAVQQGIIGGMFILLALVLLWFLSGQIIRPILALTATATSVSQGNLNIKADVQTTDETGVLANAFNLMITQLQEFFASLEARVAERTRNLELAAQVGRTVSQVGALDIMLTNAAELIRAQFDLYYVQVYLIDPSQTSLNLHAGTGLVGKELLARRHRLSFNTGSINGRAAVEKRAVIISDTAKSTTFKSNPLLPNTRSEMAVPLLIGDKVVGVLDMQSDKEGTLNDEALPAFEALAGQLAVAIQNANLLAESQQSRAEVEAQSRQLTRTNWVEYLDAIHMPEKTGFVFEHDAVTTLKEQVEPTQNALVAPLEVTGEPLGKLVVELQGGASPISRTDELINTVARQVSQQIESLRLLESAERFRYEAEQASRRLTHEGWQEYATADATNTGFIYDLKQVRPAEQNEIEQVEESGISLPVKVRDAAIGKLVVQGINSGDSEAIEIASAVAERLGAHIEGLRLSIQTEKALSASKKQAQREQALRQITSAVRGSTDPATILRTAARELGSILGRQTVVQLDTATSHQDEPIPPAETSNADGGKQ
jgi:GAF domain-containing protein/HAMP domain-containing protein